MFKSVREVDDYGNKQTHYYLTKGDSCTITSTPQRGGVSIANEVSACKFKLATSNYQILTVTDKDGNKIFPITMTKSGDSFVLNLTSAITSQIPVGSYVYEIEYTLTDNRVQTPHSWTFDIVNEIQ